MDEKSKVLAERDSALADESLINYKNVQYFGNSLNFIK